MRHHVQCTEFVRAKVQANAQVGGPRRVPPLQHIEQEHECHRLPHCTPLRNVPQNGALAPRGTHALAGVIVPPATTSRP